MSRRNLIPIIDFLDAMEKNGYKRTRGQYIKYDPYGKIESVCAVGQAALNLGLEPGFFDIISFDKVGNDITKPCPAIKCSLHYTVLGLAIHLNDDHNYSIKRNVETLRKVFDAPAS